LELTTALVELRVGTFGRMAGVCVSLPAAFFGMRLFSASESCFWKIGCRVVRSVSQESIVLYVSAISHAKASSVIGGDLEGL